MSSAATQQQQRLHRQRQRQQDDDEIIGADGSPSPVRKIGYLRKLKGWFDDDGSAFHAWNLKRVVCERVRCQPSVCRCRQRRFLLRFLFPLESEQTMKKKFFVLRSESATSPACLEYYENEKKWKSGAQPKRSIVLKTCFNINRKLDVKQKHALALYTKDDCFTMILDSEEELESWLGSLLALQQGDEDVANDHPPKPAFEHIWQVNVRNKGLASSKNILGTYHLCLTSQTLSLVKQNTSTPQLIEFPLMSIRRCGHSYCFFFMELGRSAVTGSGELWMQTEDIVIAQNMHETILNAMRSSSREEVAPRQRSRSSSTTNESSKPINVHQRRVATVLPPVSIATSPTKRERADSVPSRPRTISDGPLNSAGRKSQPWNFEPQRPLSLYAPPSSYSPPVDLLLPSPNSLRRTTDNNGGSLASIDDQFDYKHWLSSPDNSHVQKSSITEECGSCEDYLPMTPTDGESKRAGRQQRISSIKSIGGGQKNDYMDMAPSITNSPSGSEGGYMAMSPVGSFLADAASVKSLTPVKTHCPRTGEATNGYVPMAPFGSSLNKSGDDNAYLDMSSSSTPVKSGTPAEDIRFSEFQLDKVRSCFAANEIDDDEKLVRAYSVGSKLQASRQSAAAAAAAAAPDDDSSSSSSSRVRAFSVGSKAGLQYTARASCDGNKKSFSAPLLSVSSAAGIAKSQNEDLMELDFAKSTNRGDSHPKGAFRPRSSVRLASGRAGKSDLLQVIGEISNPTSSVVENNYSELSACQQSVSGEYVNIDLEKVRADRKTNCSTSESHEYANLQLGHQCRDRDKGESPYENVSYGPGPAVSSRPSSIGSDKELNYASLDLGGAATVAAVAAVAAVEEAKVTPPHSPLSVRTGGDEMERLSYARIDFKKSEGLCRTSHGVRKIRQETT